MLCLCRGVVVRGRNNKADVLVRVAVFCLSRAQHQVIQYNENVYVVGGLGVADSEGVLFCRVDRLNQTGFWQVVRDCLTPRTIYLASHSLSCALDYFRLLPVGSRRGTVCSWWRCKACCGCSAELARTRYGLPSLVTCV